MGLFNFFKADKKTSSTDADNAIMSDIINQLKTTIARYKMFCFKEIMTKAQLHPNSNKNEVLKNMGNSGEINDIVVPYLKNDLKADLYNISVGISSLGFINSNIPRNEIENQKHNSFFQQVISEIHLEIEDVFRKMNILNYDDTQLRKIIIGISNIITEEANTYYKNRILENVYSTDEKLSNFLDTHKEYETKLRLLYHIKDEGFNRKYNLKIYNDFPFSDIETKIAVAALFSGIKEVKELRIVEGRYEFVYENSGFGNLELYASTFYVFNLLAKYCYKVTSYQELKSKCYNSKEPLLIQLIENLSQNYSDKIVKWLGALLNRKELNPNITANEIFEKGINANILLINAAVYSKFFKSILEERINKQHNS